MVESTPARREELADRTADLFRRFSTAGIALAWGKALGLCALSAGGGGFVEQASAKFRTSLDLGGSRDPLVGFLREAIGELRAGLVEFLAEVETS